MKTFKPTPSSKDRFIMGLTMALHNENIILSEAERSLYGYILSEKNKLNGRFLGGKTNRRVEWRLWQ